MLRGTVVTEDGRPIAGAHIASQPGTDQDVANAEGEFELPSPPGPRSLTVSADGHATALIALDDAEEGGVTVALAPADTVAGRVVDEHRRPVAGAEVVMGRFDSPFATRYRTTVRTTRNGSFRAPRAPAQPTILIARARGRVPMAQEFGGEPLPGHSLVLTLHRGHRISGVVRHADGRAARGALVAVSGGDAVRSRSDGSFVAGGVRAGVAKLTAWHGGLAGETHVRVRRGRRPAAVIHLQAAATVAGRLLDARDGRPLAGALVRPAVNRPTDDLGTTETGRRPPTEVMTDSEGRFRLRRLPPGAIALTFSRRGYVAPRPQTVELRPGEVSELSLELQPLARVTGRVVDLGGAPVGGARVSPVTPPRAQELLAGYLHGADATSLVGTTDLRGRFALDVPAGTVRLAVTAARHARATTTALRLRAGEAREGIEVRMPQGTRIVGALVDARGAPVDRGLVIARPLERRSRGIAELDPEAVSDVRGRFAFGGLASGRYAIEVHADGFVSGRTSSARASRYGATRRLAPIRLERSAAVRGVVRSAEGEPLPGANVYAYTEARGTAVQSLGSGRFRVSGFRRGVTVTVDVLTAGYEARRLRARAGSADLEVALAETGTLSGRVVDDRTGAPIRAFTLRLEPRSRRGPRRLPQERPFFTTNGAFTWMDLPSGRASVSVRADGYRPAAPRTLVVGRGSTPPTTLRLRR